MSRKYIHGGGINPRWVLEQEQAKQKKEQEEYELVLKEREDYKINKLKDMVKELSYSASIQLKNGINATINNNEGNYQNYTLEDKFNFLKAHSDNPEDLELAKQILRIK